MEILAFKYEDFISNFLLQKLRKLYLNKIYIYKNLNNIIYIYIYIYI